MPCQYDDNFMRLLENGLANWVRTSDLMVKLGSCGFEPLLD